MVSTAVVIIIVVVVVAVVVVAVVRHICQHCRGLLDGMTTCLAMVQALRSGGIQARAASARGRGNDVAIVVAAAVSNSNFILPR